MKCEVCGSVERSQIRRGEPRCSIRCDKIASGELVVEEPMPAKEVVE